MVRVFDSNETTKEGWIPASILGTIDSEQQTEKAIYGDRVDDAAYRRQYTYSFLYSESELLGYLSFTNYVSTTATAYPTVDEIEKNNLKIKNCRIQET